MSGEPDNSEVNPQPRPLEYRSARDERRQWPVWVQALIGFLLTAGTAGGANFIGGLLVYANSFSTLQKVAMVSAIGVAPLLVFGWIGLSLRRRGRWPAFLPGALAGWGLAALVGGICFARGI